MSLSVIIPSRNASNFTVSGAAVRLHEPDARIVLVDDGISLDLSRAPSCQVVPGVKPFIFARNINAGIRFAGTDDVVLLNDDAILETAGGLSALATASAENPRYGLISATTNNTGNRNQYQKQKGLREEPRMVCFICVFIPRRTIDAVGLLDERFAGYGMDDDDYCLRVRQAGLKIGIHDDCFVDHRKLASTFRGKGVRPSADFKPNLELFKAKWGMDNWGRPA